MATALSSSSKTCLTRSSSSSSRRLVVRPVPFSSSSTSRARTVQVCAKGKGGRMRAPMAPTGEMIRPQSPEIDPDNEEFCVFTRTTQGTYKNWIFVSVVKGGATANTLVKAMDSAWGRTLYSNTLIRSIGATCYNDRDAIVKGLKEQIKRSLQFSQQAPQAKIMEPVLNQPVTSFEFAFKIRDKRRPGDFAKAEGLTIIPSEAEIANNPLQQFQKFFSPESLSSLAGGSSS